ncbi:NifU family protein [Cytophagaceae bacterium ABcell3]|nr:NifU family protein [Cytophagaceae bacterium ABcell3]
MENDNKQYIEIYTEASPNPNSLKFVTNQMLLPEGIADYASVTEAENCPLAIDLFRFSFVKRVFITANFVTVTKAEDIEWIEVTPMLRELIRGYLEEGKPLFKKEIEINNAISSDDPEIVQKIKVLLDEYIRPAVEQDGGAISFGSYEDGVVKVLLQGSCSGCPSSTVTLKSGIENLMKKMIPEVKEVVAENL